MTTLLSADKNDLSKLDQLFIRGCKSNDPSKRVVSVYRRYYHRNCDPTSPLVSILSKVCQQYSLMSTFDTLCALHPNNRWKLSEEPSLDSPENYNDLCLKYLINVIRFTANDKFPPMPYPAIIKNSILEHVESSRLGVNHL